MREIIPQVNRWLAAGERVGLATVITTWGSSPRGLGAQMAFNDKGEMVGSVSGGCVEGAVIERGIQLLDRGTAEVLHFGVADETAWEVGLACGGEIDVLVQPLDQIPYEKLQNRIHDQEFTALVSLIRGDVGQPGDSFLVTPGEALEAEGWRREASHRAKDAIESGERGIGTRALGQAGNSSSLAPGQEVMAEIFINVFPAPPELLVIGGVHIAIPLVRMAKELGYRTVLVDPRRNFVGSDRFLGVDELRVEWPQQAFQELPITGSTAVVALTHDPKIDDPALTYALQSEAFYVGALGSRKTQADRVKRLEESGLTEDQLGRLKGPIGLDIGARTPEEIAVSILAEIVAARYGKAPG